ncbi:MAG: NADH-quinone oxidoreductase subunit J [Bryobacteraceae bacterium]|jgi:NADH-quinone oxidoreductase subunit J|nr:NADH-quinone oxidoreductase subunit J [Bryobacteraceae bacterium]
MFDVPLFLTFAAIAVACAINLVLQTHPISSALSLVGVMGSLAVLYLLLGGQFIAAVQLIVYAGAIMVLFVFVIMLLNAGAEKRPSRRVLGAAVALPLLFTAAALGAVMITTQIPKTAAVKFGAFQLGGAASIGRELFTRYLLPFEVTSILILIAILGAIVLARKEI